VLSNIELDPYRIAEVEKILTPALAIYPEIVDWNIARTIERLGNDSNRWRPHVKTAKLAYVIGLLVARGIRNFKCSTPLELSTLREAGAEEGIVRGVPVLAAQRDHRITGGQVHDAEVEDEKPRHRGQNLGEAPQQIARRHAALTAGRRPPRRSVPSRP